MKPSSLLIPLAFSLACTGNQKGEKASSLSEIAQEARTKPAESLSIDLAVSDTLDKVRAALLATNEESASLQACSDEERSIIDRASRLQKEVLGSGGFDYEKLRGREISGICPEGEFIWGEGHPLQAFFLKQTGNLDQAAVTEGFFASHWTPCQRAATVFTLQLCAERGDCVGVESYGYRFSPGGAVGGEAERVFEACEARGRKIEKATREGVLTAEQVMQGFTGTGRFVYSEDHPYYQSYKGGWEGGEFSGPGTLVLEDGSKLNGHFSLNGPDDTQPLKYTPTGGTPLNLEPMPEAEGSWFVPTDEAAGQFDIYTWKWRPHSMDIEHRQAE